MGTFKDAIKESSRIAWSLEGKNRLVKVVSPTAEEMVLKHGTAMGFVTQEKYLYGKTCNQIEQLLGLRPFELRDIAYIYALAELPKSDEFEFELTCAFPDGAYFGDKERAAMMKAREEFKAGHSKIMQFYPPGSGMVPQWRLTKPMKVSGRIAMVTRVMPFPRQSNSVQPYRRYGREIQ